MSPRSDRYSEEIITFTFLKVLMDNIYFLSWKNDDLWRQNLFLNEAIGMQIFSASPADQLDLFSTI